MLSRDRDVAVTVVLGVNESVFVVTDALGSMVDDLFERNAWCSCWCNRTEFGDSPH